MKWSKALSLLIGMFLIVNMILGYANYQKHIKAYYLSTDQVKTITQILKDRGISVKCDLPLSYRPQESIWLLPRETTIKQRDELIKRMLSKDLAQVMISKEISQGIYDEEVLVYSFEDKELRFKRNEINYINQAMEKNDTKLSQSKALAIAEDFAELIEIENAYEKVKIEYKIESYGAVVTYYEVYKGFPIFDSYMRMDITPQGVQSAQVKTVVKAEKVGNVKPVYPVNKVLFAIDEQMSEKAPLVITNVEMGYAMKNAQGMHILEEEAIPMYKIEIEGLSGPVFVNAYTNTVEYGQDNIFYK